jgi:hypothetical protein
MDEGKYGPVLEEAGVVVHLFKYASWPCDYVWPVTAF